jgi:hypothetical protein
MLKPQLLSAVIFVSFFLKHRTEKQVEKVQDCIIPKTKVKKRKEFSL